MTYWRAVVAVLQRLIRDESMSFCRVIRLSLPADEVVKEVYGGDKEEPREGVVAIQGGGLPLDAGAFPGCSPSALYLPTITCAELRNLAP